MSLVDRIKTEYMLYEVGELPTAEIATKIVLDVFTGDMEETISSSKIAMVDNFKEEQVTKVKNFFLDLFGYEGENLEQFGKDTGIVLRISCLAERYKGYFDKMQEATDSDNFIEMYKLAMFTYQNFTSNYHYLESLRDSIRFAVDGVTYYGNGEDSQGEFAEFFKETLQIAIGSKRVYKK